MDSAAPPLSQSKLKSALSPPHSIQVYVPRILGSSTSRNASPKTANENVINARATPGKIESHGASSIFDFAAD